MDGKGVIKNNKSRGRGGGGENKRRLGWQKRMGGYEKPGTGRMCKGVKC